ncbi:hypothetical protein FN846DRAFT_906516 [Sphaerosporella brunnea]|uniref:Uncharacterized protein n=1 Tax=Sphaerosporella brunnea TaxID=1250544 RepID=A0A5J5EY77_9PEZI|nr:hypothetical protein FN846DRAFT_906516 [Sphaerosporella brunnea]
MATTADQQTQQLLERDDVSKATEKQVALLGERVSAARHSQHMFIYYYVCVRSAFVSTGLIDDPDYTLDGPMSCAKQRRTLPQDPDKLLLRRTIDTLRRCQLFQHAAIAVQTRSNVNVPFDEGGEIALSSGLEQLQQPALQIVQCKIGLAHDHKRLSNALIQVILCVPELRRLLQVDEERAQAVARGLLELDSARDTATLQARQRKILNLFPDCRDSIPDVLAAMRCAPTVTREETVSCLLHSGFVNTYTHYPILQCKGSIPASLAACDSEQRELVNRHCADCNTSATFLVRTQRKTNETGVLLVQPSNDHPFTDGDESCAHWELCAGIMDDGSAIYRKDDEYYVYVAPPRVPFGIIEPLSDTVAGFCCGRGVELLFYVKTPFADAQPDSPLAGLTQQSNDEGPASQLRLVANHHPPNANDQSIAGLLQLVGGLPQLTGGLQQPIGGLQQPTGASQQPPGPLEQWFSAVQDPREPRLPTQATAGAALQQGTAPGGSRPASFVDANRLHIAQRINELTLADHIPCELVLLHKATGDEETHTASLQRGVLLRGSAQSLCEHVVKLCGLPTDGLRFTRGQCFLTGGGHPVSYLDGITHHQYVPDTVKVVIEATVV